LNRLLTVRRLGALAGVASIVLFIVAGAVEGNQPKLTATAATITSYYASHHSKVLVGDLLIAVSAILLIVWAAVLAAELRAAGRQAAAGALLATVAARGAVAVVASAIEIGVDQAAVRSTDPGFMHGADLVDAYVGNSSFLFLGTAAAALALGAGGLFSAWYRWLTGLAGVLAILIGISVKQSGFFSPASGGEVVAVLVIFVWVLVTSVMLWRAPPSAASSDHLRRAPTGQAASA
jgi:hypothetical protein